MKVVLRPLEKPVAILVAILFLCLHGAAQTNSAASPSYDQLVVTASSLLKEGKLDEARQAAQQAIRQNSDGYLAYAVAAKISAQQGASADSANFIQKALQLAPDDESRAKVKQLATMINLSARVPEAESSTAFSSQERRKLEALKLIKDDAANAATPDEERKFLLEYLDKSSEFIKDDDKILDVWTMRAVIGLKLNRPKLAWEAGQKLKVLGAENSSDPSIIRLLAQLDRKGLLSDTAPSLQPIPGSIWENDLGMSFVPIEGTRIHILSRPVAVGEFVMFLQEYTNDDIQAKSYLSLPNNTGRSALLDRNVGRNADECAFASYDAAEAFCDWLTERDRKANLIDGLAYRLPTRQEFSVSGSDRFVSNDLALLSGELSPVQTVRIAGGGSGTIGGGPYVRVLGVEDGETADQIRRLWNGHHSIEQLDIYPSGGFGFIIVLDRDVGSDNTPSSATPSNSPSESDAAFQTGLKYFRGDSVPKDSSEAIRWWRKAATAGNLQAMDHIGVCYATGDGVGKDLAEAVKWYQRAAGGGNLRGEMHLAFSIATGHGIPKDPGEALKWFRIAAEGGEPVGQRILGDYYEHGWVVKKDVTEALIWYRKAAAQGDTDAQASLKRLSETQ